MKYLGEKQKKKSVYFCKFSIVEYHGCWNFITATIGGNEKPYFSYRLYLLTRLWVWA